MIDWVYQLQVCNVEGIPLRLIAGNTPCNSVCFIVELVSGFQGSTTLNTIDNNNQNSTYKWGHIATTYSSLLTLLILGDNLDRVDRKGIVQSKKISKTNVRE